MKVFENAGSSLAEPSAAAIADQVTIAAIMTAQANVAAGTPVPQAAAANPATVQVPAFPSSELFGSFVLGKQEFALPALRIREVVNVPDRVTPIPLSPPFLEGVFTLRGSVIPLVNLGRIFDPSTAGTDRSHRVVILDHGQVQVGLLFDDTGEILRVRPEQCSQLEYRDAAIHGVISGTIRLGNGERLLQVLDPDALLHIENLPHILALKSAGREDKSTRFHLQTERRQGVSFRVGRTAFAFEMSAIREIIKVPELKSSVLNSALCMGWINLRGNAVAVVNFSSLLGLAGSEQLAADQRIVIARIGDSAIGLLVDSVDSIFSFFPIDILPIPLIGKARAGMFAGCIHKETLGEILFLNHQAIFSRAEIVDLTNGHVNLYQQEAAGSHPDGSGTRNIQHRQTYITFSAGSPCAVEITKIREIIDCSRDLLKPPNMPSFIHGILNLRQQMITIIDVRSLYGIPPSEDPSAAKILIIERGEERYGLMVDAVENIVTLADRDRVAAPKIMRTAGRKDILNEMQEVINVTAEDDSRQTLSVFDVDLFMDRLTSAMAE